MSAGPSSGRQDGAAQTLAGYEYTDWEVKTLTARCPAKAARELQVALHTVACPVHSRACPSPGALPGFGPGSQHLLLPFFLVCHPDSCQRLKNAWVLREPPKRV